MIDRRDCIGMVVSSLVALPRRAGAQPVERVYRVGILRPYARPLSPSDPTATGIETALRERGYVEGRNLMLEQRYADGDPDRLPALAQQLLQARVEVLVAVTAPAVRAARAATATIPIVMLGNFDPVALGLVASLARPGGNITGILIGIDGTLTGKRLELLRAAVPRAARIGFLVPDENSYRLQLKETRDAASLLGIELATSEVHGTDYAGAFKALAAQRPGALLVASSSYFLRDRQAIIALAATHRLPAMYDFREHVVDGGLMAYSTSLTVLYQRVAASVDRILKGAQPGDLAVERPSKLELFINLKTARALGLTIPQSLLLRADEVIQ